MTDKTTNSSNNNINPNLPLIHPSQAPPPPAIYPSPGDGGPSTGTIECRSQDEIANCVTQLFAQRLYVLSCCRNPWCQLSKSPPFPSAAETQQLVPAIWDFHQLLRGPRLDRMQEWYAPDEKDSSAPGAAPVGRFEVPVQDESSDKATTTFPLCPSAFSRSFGFSKDDGYSYLGATKHSKPLHEYFTQLFAELSKLPDHFINDQTVCTGKPKKDLYPKYKHQYRNAAVPKHVFLFYWEAQFPHIHPGIKENVMDFQTTTGSTAAVAGSDTTQQDLPPRDAAVAAVPVAPTPTWQHEFIKNPELDKKRKRPIRRNCHFGGCKKTTHWTCAHVTCRAHAYNANGTNVRGRFYCKDHHEYHKQQMTSSSTTTDKEKEKEKEKSTTTETEDKGGATTATTTTTTTPTEQPLQPQEQQKPSVPPPPPSEGLEQSPPVQQQPEQAPPPPPPEQPPQKPTTGEEHQPPPVPPSQQEGEQPPPQEPPEKKQKIYSM